MVIAAGMWSRGLESGIICGRLPVCAHVPQVRTNGKAAIGMLMWSIFDVVPLGLKEAGFGAPEELATAMKCFANISDIWITTLPCLPVASGPTDSVSADFWKSNSSLRSVRRMGRIRCGSSVRR